MTRALGEGVSGVGLDVGLLCDAVWPAHLGALARGLIERGHRVHVLCGDDSGALAPWTTQDLERDGVSVRRVGLPEPAGAPADLLFDARARDVVLAWLAEVPCDVVHALGTRDLRPGALRAISDMGRPLLGEAGDPGLACFCGRALREHADHDVRSCAQRLRPELLPAAADAQAAALRAWVEGVLELVALPQRTVAIEPRTDGEGARAMVLEHERLYAELALAVTGRLPRLAHPIAGLSPAPVEPQRAGWLARLLGRRDRS